MLRLPPNTIPDTEADSFEPSISERHYIGQQLVGLGRHAGADYFDLWH